MEQAIRLIRPSQRATFYRSLLLHLAKNVASALTSDLFESPSFVRYNLTFCRSTPASRDRTAKLAKSSELTVQRDSLRGHDPQVVDIPQHINKWHSATCTVQKECTNGGLLQIQMESIMPDL
jgi:hypothetical protein